MKKLVVAAPLKPLLLDTLQFLKRSEISILTADSQDDVLKLHLGENANLLATDTNMPGMSCEALVHTIRRSEAMRNVSVVLVCEDSPDARRRAEMCGANAVVARPVEPALLADKFQRLLDVAPRRAYRVVLNAVMEGRHDNRPFICSSVNVSARGMLIRSPETFSRGDHLSCSFYLPDGSRISVGGQIVRIVTRLSDSDARQYGIQFTNINPDVESTLAAFVAKHHGPGMDAGMTM
jgi:CheY-like chemotaxis protein